MPSTSGASRAARVVRSACGSRTTTASGRGRSLNRASSTTSSGSAFCPTRRQSRRSARAVRRPPERPPPRYDEALARLHRDGRVYGCDCSRAETCEGRARRLRRPRRRLLTLAGGRSYGRGMEGRRAALRRVLQGPGLQPGPGIGAASAWNRASRRSTMDFGTPASGAAGAMRRPAGSRSARLLDLSIRRRGRRPGRGHHRRHPRPRILPSTGRQISWPACSHSALPAFLHHPLIVGADGQKLSKSRQDTGLRELRAAGLTPAAVIARAEAALAPRSLNRQSAIFNLQYKISP